MRRRCYLTAICLVLLLCAALASPALGEVRSYTYGGSADDCLGEIAVSADGRIALTGYTDSSDGTLSDRTKTGRSGWTLCVDAQGSVLWSFCTRLGTHDHITLPVFHEDGSITAVLYAEDDAGQELELIRLNARGEVILRKTMRATDVKEAFINVIYATDEGYVVEQKDQNALAAEHMLFDWNGELLRDINAVEESGIYARGEHHILRKSANMRVLFAIDRYGNEIPLYTEEIPVKREPQTDIRWLLSLADGGAIGTGRSYENSHEGVLVRWDAQGNRIFDWRMDKEELAAAVKTPNGYAALGYVIATEEPDGVDWELITFGEDGVMRGSVPLGHAEKAWNQNVMAVLPDGSIAFAQGIRESRMPGDARLIIVPKEDIP